MKRNLSQKILFIGLILFLGLLPVGADGESKQHQPDSHRGQTGGPGPEDDLKQAELLLAKYRKELPGAKASRGHILAELARLCFILGEWGGKDEKKFFEAGREYAKVLIREHPDKVEGHYWLALNLGGLAGMNGDLKLVPIIVKEMKVAAALDENYDQAGPHRILGRVYLKAPPWPLSVGDLKKSLKHLRTAVKLAPPNSTNHLFLAETLFELKETGPACRQLEQVLSATTHANWTPALKADQQKAQNLLKKCQEN